MAEDLREIRERIQHSRDEIQRLCEGIEVYTRKAFTYRSQDDGQTWSLHAQVKHPVPTALKSGAGMIANELRACLDALASKLAVRNGRSTRSVYFPISKSKEIFEKDGRKKINKLTLQDQAKIEALHPYREGNPDLFGLHALDLTRKHTDLVPAAALGGFALGKSQSYIVQSGSGMIDNCEVDGISFSIHYDTNDSIAFDEGIEFPVLVGIPYGIDVAPIPGVCYADPEEFRYFSMDLILEDLTMIVESIVNSFE